MPVLSSPFSTPFREVLLLILPTKQDLMRGDRQLSRWYDIDVAYEDINDIEFVGKISRSTSLNGVLKDWKALASGSVRGKKLTVIK